jgi:hypothetical protein
LSDQATLQSEVLAGAGGFLTVIPSKPLKLNWEIEDVVTETRCRLLKDVYAEEAFRPSCDVVMDTKGHHAKMCASEGDRIARRNAARNLVGRYASGAGLGPTLVRANLLPPRPDDPSNSNLRRPADVYLPAWDSGGPAALDLAITSLQRLASLTEAARSGGVAATRFEEHKRQYMDTVHECKQRGVSLCAISG